MSRGLSIYFWITNVLCFILFNELLPFEEVLHGLNFLIFGSGEFVRVFEGSIGICSGESGHTPFGSGLISVISTLPSSTLIADPAKGAGICAGEAPPMTLSSVFVLFLFFQLSSSLPTQYSRMSLCKVESSLKTWIPLPRLRWVGFRSHKLYPSKWLSGQVSLVKFLFSKLNCLNFVLF